jgi:glycosyltransferase involved in cell wall biosynthesis
MTLIGIVTTSYPRFAGDPAGHFVAEHARALEARGYAIDVVAAAADEPLFYRGGAPDALEASPRSLVSAASFTARLTARVAVRARRWDAIIAHWLAPSALAVLPTWAPLLAIAHGGDIYTLRRLGLLGATLRALRLRRARLAFVSEDLLAIARAAGPVGDAIVQPMGLPLAHFAALPRQPTSPPTILVAARLAPIKGVDVALAALAELRTPARMIIAGDGPERAALEALAPPSATFVGAVSTMQRDALLSQASLVVVPSRQLPNGRTEGTPLIALEALAAGVPVIATATGGLRALAPAALLVPPDHPAILAAAIDHALISAPPSPTALRAAVAHLDWSAVATVLAPTQLPA